MNRVMNTIGKILAAIGTITAMLGMMAADSDRYMLVFAIITGGMITAIIGAVIVHCTGEKVFG